MSGELEVVVNKLASKGWLQSHNEPGAHLVVDGQFGSTGKGVAASLLEQVHWMSGNKGDLISSTSAGPNSGHTSVFKGNKVVTQQLTISSVQRAARGEDTMCFLNAGAVINPEILSNEIEKYGMRGKVFVHPNAAIITEEDIEVEAAGGPALIASTGKGVGSALARKILRAAPVAKYHMARWEDYGVKVAVSPYVPDILEVSQGFSLGINQPFYPHCTSRECTVAQAMSDAGLHPSFLAKTLMAVRTFPIRVGNTEKGHSGGMYSDQREMTWDEIGVEPEFTTVTKRQRRVFSWSGEQFRLALGENRPDALFVNFLNYLKENEWEKFVHNLTNTYIEILGQEPDAVILGWGPNTEDVTLW